MTPDAFEVLADALYDALPQTDAEDVLRWARHPDAVRTLLRAQQLTAGGRCVGCQELSGRAHAEGCVMAEAARQLELSWAAPVHELDLAHEEALRHRP
jgi:hypothetical protein